MVRGEYRRVIFQDRRNRRVAPEFILEEKPYTPSVPSIRMGKIGVKGKVSVIEPPCLEPWGDRPADGHIEYREVEEVDAVAVLHGKFKGLPSPGLRLRRRAKDEINIGSDSRFFQVLQGDRSHLNTDPFLQGVEHTLIPGFDTELEHDTSRLFQRHTEIGISQVVADAAEPVPGDAYIVAGNGIEERRTYRVVEKMDKHGVCLF